MLTDKKVVGGSGATERLESAEKSLPGDVIEYSAAYKNVSVASLGQVAATLPVPTGTGYVVGTAKPPLELASLDGVTFAPVPLKRKVRDEATGQEKTIDVPIHEYRSLRWTFPTLAAGKTETVTARMRLDTNDSPVAAVRARRTLMAQQTDNIALVGGGTMQRGTYTLISYGGTLTGSTMTIGNVPSGVSSADLQISVDTAAKKVYLIYSGSSQSTYWDATPATKNNYGINGGTGVWTALSSNTNWTTSTGQTNGSWAALSATNNVANFGGASGTVTVDVSAGAINIGGLTFTTDGYTVTGNALTGTATSNPLNAAANVSATVNSVCLPAGTGASRRKVPARSSSAARTFTRARPAWLRAPC